jgi:hypothetical protein
VPTPTQNRLVTDRPWLFQPGNRANPGGRPKGLAALVKAETGDGAELVAFMLRVLRGRRQPLRLRMEACAWLADRAFGKAPQPLTGEDGGPVEHRVYPVSFDE